MKLTAILLLTAALHVSATGVAQTLTLQERNISLSKLFTLIHQQSGYSFIYNNQLLKGAPKVSVHVRNATVEDVLNTCFQGQSLTFIIEDKIITVRQGAPVAPDAQPLPPQTVRGTVRDENGKALPGATVLLKPGQHGTQTLSDGSFVIDGISPGVYTLEVSYIGYGTETRSVSVDGSTVSVSIVLHQSNLHTDTVVVTALGIRRSSRSTSYNVQTLTSADVNDVKDPSFVNSLEGKVAGATINPSASGIGGSTRVILRGVKSLTGNNNALYVVDGIPLPNLFTGQPSGLFGGTDGGDGIANFNPDDIESISVLTGAAAAALYGNQAANGVILITTKKGSAGKTHVNLNTGVTYYTPFVLPKFQNTYGATAPGAYDSWGARLSQASSYKPRDFFQTGDNFTTAVDVSTGTDKSQTYFSAASASAKGIIPNNDFSRYNFTARNTSSFYGDRLNLDVSAMYLAQSQQNIPGQGQYNNPLLPVYLFPPSENIDSVKDYEQYDPSRNFKVQYWPYGDLGFEAENPYWIINRQIYTTKRERFMGTVALKYNILPGLSVTGRFKYDNANDVTTSKLYASTLGFLAGGPDGSYSYGTANNKQSYADVLANYNKQFSDFSVNATLGASIIDNKTSNSSVGGPLLTVPNFFSLTNISTANLSVSQTLPEENQTQAVFFSGTLGYKQRLFLDVSARNDWSSGLAFTNHASIFYPSVGLSDILSDELRMPSFISFLKLRTSYSEVGNAPSPYLTNPVYTISSNTLTNYTTVPFQTLKPELTGSFEAGFDLRLANNQIALSATYYNASTRDQLFTVTVPASTGYSGYYINAGKVRNEGVEASLGWYGGRIGAVSWTPGFTFSLNRNKIIQMLNPFKDPFTGELTSQDSLVAASSGSYEMILAKGGTTQDIYAEGLQKDANGNLVTDANGLPVVDNTHFKKVGHASPDFNLGFSNGFAYKGFSLNFLVDARVGGTVVSATQSIMDYYGVSRTSADARDAGGVEVNGTKVNAQSYYKVVAGASGGTTGALALYTYSATNVRLRELSFGYTLPGKWFADKIQGVKVALVARNLWMIYNKAPYDPESAASTSTFYQGYDYFNQPSLRNIGFNVNVSF
ncbi:MAG TPA: SusC/RagA family TonB-linked outer membrane protein [Dinghuibacter sp.]|uniref:SusC/RagA family TonB-linked outer membrane protein n=1 Tax=Dinghuibacter sp. TaxID=2024697 RepID=UPI002BD716A5|nr:SusC/RagA family TonB-linked outer membrane protein [Dinghuibacter sp.]HTJ12559.1 SusC/RagA family TonB-linked outer membrane protein [Dinghuibacter sp.]